MSNPTLFGLWHRRFDLTRRARRRSLGRWFGLTVLALVLVWQLVGCRTLNRDRNPPMQESGTPGLDSLHSSMSDFSDLNSLR